MYTGKEQPRPLRNELPADGEYGMMGAIRIVPRSKQEKLAKESRVNFAKIYTVEHNVKVYDFGDVYHRDLVSFKTQWKYVLTRDQNGNREPGYDANKEEDDDDEDEEDDDDGGVYEEKDYENNEK